MNNEHTYEETGLEVAVIGMAGRFPGARDIGQFWDNLTKGVETVTFFDDAQLEAAGIDAALINNPNYVKAHARLDDIDYFDASFFGYTPREAELLDPQVRVFLETTLHTLEDGGYDPDRYDGLIGLYAGGSPNFLWQGMTFMSGAGGSIDPFSAYHLKEKDFLCVHVAYRLNLKGPAVMVSTACSTSLVAIILACQALLSGECDMALAGGTNVQLPQDQGYLYQEGMITSPDGHCRAFDAQAAGTVSGNGVALVLLKLLEKAREEGDRIYAVIKGSGMNNDGSRKAGFTAPSVDGQAEAIKAALGMADVTPESMGYIETHGTGTHLGDPVEVEALKLAFDSQPDSPKKNYCGIGSVKSNFGHVGSAAGVAGFIKAVLALKNRLIPPSLHFSAPNPKIDFANSPFYVNAQLKEWTDGPFPRRAGVSSFGIGGTNAHVILEEYPVNEAEKAEEITAAAGAVQEKGNHLLLLSAQSETSLQKATGNLADFFKNNRGLNLSDASYTLAVARKRLPHRRAIVCSSLEEAVEILASPGSPKRFTAVSREDKRPVMFLFPGQGAQYVNMGRQLYENQPVFRKEMDRCFKILAPLMDTDIKTVLFPGMGNPNGSASAEHSSSSKAVHIGGPGGALTPSRVAGPWPAGRPLGEPPEAEQLINQTRFTQPLLFALEYALARLLDFWGIKPFAMMGHSIGEYVAAHLSGVFSLEDVLSLVVLRGQCMQRMPAGSMMSVSLGEEVLKPFLTASISLAAVNTPGLCTVSGTDEAIEAFRQRMEQMGHQCRRLFTSHAFHSAMMDPILEEFRQAVAKLALKAPEVPYISNLTGQWIREDEAMSPGYWADHLRYAVRFADGAGLLLAEENALFLEVGPGMVLSTFVGKHTAKQNTHKSLNLVRHPKETEDDDTFLLGKLGQLWLYGQEIDWDAFYGEGRRRIDLPLYPFNWQKFPVTMDISGAQQQQQPLVKNRDMTEWFYQPAWKQVRLPAQPPAGSERISRCLLFAPDSGILDNWKELLGKKGIEVLEVKRGTQFSHPTPATWTLDPAEPEHYELLLKGLAEENNIPQGIFHCWNLDDVTCESQPETLPLTEGRLKEAADLGYYSLLNLARAVGKLNVTERQRVMVLSNGLFDVSGEGVHRPEKAVLLGPVRVIPQEFPNLLCRSIDISLPPSGSGAEEILVQRLLGEMAHKTADLADRAVAYRFHPHTQQWVRWELGEERFPLEAPAARGSNLKEGGVYLITGGLGGIGLVLANQIAQRVKGKLVLTGRSPFPAPTEWDQWMTDHPDVSTDPISAKIMGLREIEKLGSEVLPLQADVSVSHQLTEALRTAEERLGPINGVIHSAGVADGAIIQRRTREMSESVFAAKLYGTLHLENFFKDRDLDFMILCSSLSSILAPLGQVAYTSANCFLDAYAHLKQAMGQPVTSINWDTWLQVGMAEAAREQLGGAVNPTMDEGILPPEGGEILERVMADLPPEVLVCTKDLPTLLLQKDIQRKGETEAGTATGGEGDAPKQLYQRPELSTEYVAPGTEEEKMLAQLLQQLLGIDRVGIFDNFFELGVSSLDVININSQLKEMVGFDISTVIIFEHPTIHALARYLETQKGGDEGAAAPEPVEKQDRAKAIDTGKNRLKGLRKKTGKKETPNG